MSYTRSVFNYKCFINTCTCLPSEWKDDNVLTGILPLKTREDLRILVRHVDSKGTDYVCNQVQKKGVM
jgi:hypothetical protein